MSKHTKGPWVYDGKSRDVIRNNSGTAICQLYKIHADSLEADANLIAAAPELLEACLAAFKALPSSGQDSELFWKLKNAIRKAERGEWLCWAAAHFQTQR